MRLAAIAGLDIRFQEIVGTTTRGILRHELCHLNHFHSLRSPIRESVVSRRPPSGITQSVSKFRHRGKIFLVAGSCGRTRERSIRSLTTADTVAICDHERQEVGISDGEFSVTARIKGSTKSATAAPFAMPFIRPAPARSHSAVSQ